jgi:hypothetical protein
VFVVVVGKRGKEEGGVFCGGVELSCQCPSGNSNIKAMKLKNTLVNFGVLSCIEKAVYRCISA